MDTLFRIIVGLIGLWFVIMVIRSACKAALVNASSREIITGTVSRCLYWMMSLVMGRQATYRKRQKVLSWFGPFFLLICILMYFVLTMTGFALIYWALKAEPTLFRSFISSGSALSTLGFYTPTTPLGQIVAIVEGGVGLGVVVFLITFVPGYQSAIQEREEMSARLYARTDDSPDCESIYAWAALSGKSGNLDAYWDGWEDFLRDIGDVHAESPVLIFTPSIRIGQSWVVSVFAVMDAVNMAATSLKGQGKASAAVCLKEGISALKKIAEALHVYHDSEPRALVSRKAYDALCGRLAQKGYEMETNTEVSWLEFKNNRAQYEQVLVFLAETLFVTLPSSLTRFEEPDTDRAVVSNVEFMEERES